MRDEVIKKIFDQFDIAGDYLFFDKINSGNINDTYLIHSSSKSKYILQRINDDVFGDIPKIVENKIRISDHLKIKLSLLYPNDWHNKLLIFIKSKKGLYYYQDHHDRYWTLSKYIEDSITYQQLLNPAMAYEAGRITGEFLALMSDYNSNLLYESIPQFHLMSKRFHQLEHALKYGNTTRIKKTRSIINDIFERKSDMHRLERAINDGEIPIRVTHNDTKLSNILFSRKDKKAICLIDTDTVMPGIIHYDYGDAMRSIGNTTSEDQIDLSRVDFNMIYYNAYTRGFLEKVQESITPTEIKLLPVSIQIMTFIMVVRFITDYLNDDIYFKIDYPDHNLNRARCQLQLMKRIEEKLFS